MKVLGAGLPHGNLDYQTFFKCSTSYFHRMETTKVMMGLIMREIRFKGKEITFFKDHKDNFTSSPF